MEDDYASLIRQVRQRLESLHRAGVDRIAFPAGSNGPPERITEAALAAPEAEAAAGRRTRPAPALPAAPPSSPAVGSMEAGSVFAASSLEIVAIPAAEREQHLAALAAEVACCTRCPHLAAKRTQTVFGEGNPNARLMFVGEAPGYDEDRTGRPFVGRAGMLLTDIITKGMGLDRSEVYIANVLKSRPPENRTPLPDEVAHCLPYLQRQIEIVYPQYLCLLGKTAASALLGTTLNMGMLRKKWHSYRGIPTIVTYHPSYLLRNPPAKRDVWEDMQILMGAMGIQPPSRRGDDNGTA